jgi:hypothetical protein
VDEGDQTEDSEGTENEGANCNEENTKQISFKFIYQLTIIQKT